MDEHPGDDSSTPNRQDFLGRAGSVAALGAALLPVAGIVERLVAFLAAPLRDRVPIDLAWSAPIAALALTGIAGVLLTAIPTFLVDPYLVIQSRRQSAASPRLGVAVRAVALLLLMAWALVMPSWPLALVVLLGAVGGDLLVKREINRAGRLVLSRAWVTVLIVLAYGAVLLGFSGIVIGAAAYDFRFRPELAGAVHDGRYVTLGDDGSALWLQDCTRPNDPVIAIDRSLVLERRASTYQAGLGPSLWQVLTEHRAAGLGFRSPC
jgi:hypothetical protein